MTTDTTQTRAMTLSQPQPGLPSESEFVTMQRLCEMFYESDLYPHIKNVAQAIAIVQTGRELGIPPSVALREFSIIGGKPAASAGILAALAQRDNGDLALRVTEITDDQCTVEFKRRSWPSPSKVTFTMADAKKAGLLDKQQTRNGTRDPNPNWFKFPRAMLRSRAISEATRTAFQDSILGMYTPEELAPDSVTVTPDGEIVYTPSVQDTMADDGVIEGEQVVEQHAATPDAEPAENDPQQVLRLNARITELCAALNEPAPKVRDDLVALGKKHGWVLTGTAPASVTWKEQLIVRLEVARLRATVAAALAADPDAAAKLPKDADAMTAEELDKTLTWLQNRARRHAPAITEPACDEALEPGPTASPLGEPWTEPDVLNPLAAATQEEIDGIAAEIGMSVNAGVLTEDLARQLRACVTLARRAFTVTSAGSMAQVEINAGEMRTNLDLTVDQYDALIALTHRVRAMRGWVASNGANSRQAATAGAGTR